MKTETTTAAETAAVAEQAAPVAPEQAASTKTSKAKKAAPKGQKAAKKAETNLPATKRNAVAKAAKKAAKKEAKAKPVSKKADRPTDGQPREGSKKQIVLDMMRRKNGATLAEIAKATEWQNHSIRGFISIAAKKQGLKIESTKNEAGERTYRIAN